MASVLGLVHRDLLLDIADAVAAEDPAAVFALAGRAVESGYELRSVVRELARLTRDLMVVKIDPSRATRSRDRRRRARARPASSRWRRAFSSEDLMRAFEVLTKAEYEIRGSTQPRYHLEMALLRWIHLRKLVPLSDLIQGFEKGAPSPKRTGSRAAGRRPPAAAPAVRCTAAASAPRPRRSRPSRRAARRRRDRAAAAAAATPAGRRSQR